MMRELVLKLDWCKLGSRVKALPGEAQNFGSFGRACINFARSIIIYHLFGTFVLRIFACSKSDNMGDHPVFLAKQTGHDTITMARYTQVIEMT